MNVSRLRGSKRKVFEILNSTSEGQDILKVIISNPQIIVNYGSTKTFINNKNKLNDLLAILLNGTLHILNYLNGIKDHNLIENEYTKVIGDALQIRGKVVTSIKDFFGLEEINNDAILNFIDKLDKASDIDDTGVAFSNIVGASVFKQIYTMMYNFVLDYCGITKTKYVKVKGGYTASTNIHSEEYELIVPEDIKTGSKKSQIMKWISSRWNWTLPICCFDKIIHCYSKYFEILTNVHKYLPTIKFLSTVLKCGAESFLNCYDVGFVNNTVILRTSKQIKNDGSGLYLSVRPTNRTYNFHNLKVKGENSEQKSWYKLLIDGELIGMDKAESQYNNNIKVSSSMQSYADYNKPKAKTTMEVDSNKLLSYEEYKAKYNDQIKQQNLTEEQVNQLYQDYLKNPKSYN